MSHAGMTALSVYALLRGKTENTMRMLSILLVTACGTVDQSKSDEGVDAESNTAPRELEGPVYPLHRPLQVGPGLGHRVLLRCKG